MDTKNGSKMSLAVGNSLLIRHGANNSALVACRLRNPCLAINWQRADIDARDTCRDRRFPTPPQRYSTTKTGLQKGRAVTTSHLLLPNERRKAALSLPNWLRNLAVLVRMRQLPPGGGHPRRCSRRPRPKRAHGILCLIPALWSLHELRSN